jgi:NADPH:quinone reductase-like Zn-dependent oxidoreductase
MKAMVATTYRSPNLLKLKEVKKPTPQDDEVLIHVHAAAANAGDWHLLRGDPFMIRLTAGLRRPKPRSLVLTSRGELRR